MLNQCNFIGRLGANPEIRNTQGGQTVATVNLACSERYKDKSGQQVEETEWVKIVVWGKLAEIVGEYLHKGSLAYFSGKMKTRKWQDKEGNERYTTEIVAKEMKMLDSKGGGSRNDNSFPEHEGYGGWSGDDVPF